LKETENIQTSTQEEKPKKRSLFKKIKRLFIITGVLLIILLVTGFILASVYEKEIKQYAVKEINKHLIAEVKVNDFDKDISFSFFKKFPKASLNFNDLVILGEKKDTVLFADNISLEFGIISILSGNYTVNEIDVDNANVNLIKDKKGKENYIIWKQSTDTTDNNTPFQFDLNELNLNEVAINYTDQKTLFKSNILFNKTKFSGSFSDKKTKINVKSSHYITAIGKDSAVYFSDKESTLNFKMNLDNTTNELVIKKGDVTIQDMELAVTGNYNTDAKTYKLLANTKNLEISDIFSLLPKQVNEKLQEYATKGKIEGNATIEQLKGLSKPNITAKFDIKDGTLTEKNTNATLTNLVVDGKYTLTPSSQNIDITNVSGNISGGTFQGSGKIIGTKTMTIFSKMNGNVNLKSIAQLLNFENIENLEGDIIFNNNFRGTSTNQGIRVSEFSGKTDLKNVALKLIGKKYSLANLSGDFNFNRYTSTGTFKGEYGSSDFSISCQVKNIIQYITKNQILDVNTYIQSNQLVLDEVMMLASKPNDENNNSAETTTDSSFNLPQKVKSNISANVNTLTYGKHVLTQFKGNVFMSPNGIESKNISFKANDGIYALSGKMYPVNDKGYKLTADAICGNIDVNDFFEKFDNFGQTILQARHLKGKTDAIISLSANLNKKLDIDLNSLAATTDFTITNGELIGFEMFDEIADYIRGNTIAKSFVKVDMLSQKLKHVRFNTMTNQIVIKDQKITIPDMLIKTSAMDIGMYGDQTFLGKINYGINFRLSDVLTNKQQSEFGYIKDDGTGTRMFISMYGTIDEPLFKLDNSAKKRYIAKKKLAERNNLKSILKKEFGFFKKDTTVKTTVTEPIDNSPKFEIEWEDEEENTPTKTTTTTGVKTTTTEPEKEKKKSWFQKFTDKNKEEDKKVGFEVEE
jgi:hypothetical protein